jgi:hypothetical protein
MPPTKTGTMFSDRVVECVVRYRGSSFDVAHDDGLAGGDRCPAQPFGPREARVLRRAGPFQPTTTISSALTS